jgi:hypothetical protein
MSTESFYRHLPTLQSFLDVTNPGNFAAVPDDWYIVITDICDSTAAIEAGYYKEVNLLGACSISVALNLAQGIEIPFVFGGDGATLLIPPSLFAEVRKGLADVRNLAKSAFNLDLRVGIVPVSVVMQAGYEVKVARLRISPNYHQAMLTGGGLNYAVQLIKHPVSAEMYAIADMGTDRADLTGLECRWQDIPSRHGEVVSLLVIAMQEQSETNAEIYRQVLEEIHRLYGDDEYLNPVVPEGLHLTFRNKKLSGETRLRSKSHHWFDQMLYLCRIKLENLLGFCLMKFKLTIGTMNWGQYREIVSASTDYKKFDDALRMTIAGTPAQRKKLVSYLEKQFQAGKLVYGLRTSDRALMTCLVFERHGQQVHFIDAADGGYALAAKSLKQQLKLASSCP